MDIFDTCHHYFEMSLKICMHRLNTKAKVLWRRRDPGLVGGQLRQTEGLRKSGPGHSNCDTHIPTGSCKKKVQPTTTWKEKVSNLAQIFYSENVRSLPQATLPCVITQVSLEALCLSSSWDTGLLPLDSNLDWYPQHQLSWSSGLQTWIRTRSLVLLGSALLSLNYCSC